MLYSLKGNQEGEMYQMIFAIASLNLISLSCKVFF